jgi:hypothetical protein
MPSEGFVVCLFSDSKAFAGGGLSEMNFFSGQQCSAQKGRGKDLISGETSKQLVAEF